MITQLRNWVRVLRLLVDPVNHQWLKECREDFQRIVQLRESFPSCFVDRAVQIHGTISNNLLLGDRVRLARGTIIALSETAADEPQLAIGSRTYIGEYCNLRAAAGTSIKIGEGCLISQFCSVIADNHATPRGEPIAASGIDARRRGVVIGDDVWLGVGTSVLAGVRIGSGAVLGANSVVNREVPENEVWAGCPAAKIGERT